MDQAQIENRPYPYYTTEANLLKQVKESAAEGLFKSFQLLLGKDVRENGVKFEVLLGVYTNAIQFVKFLETSLAIGCVNTEFKDLRRMTNGKIQFKISVPTIAHGDGRRPTKQKQYIVMKACSKHHISTEIELAVLDLEILNSTQETPLDVTEYIGAVKTITSALQFGVDALERGLVDTVLNVKLRSAPPLFIVKSLSDPTYSERGLKKTVKSDLVSMFKNHLVEHSFFLDKATTMPKSQAYILSMLSEIMGSVCSETVFKGVSSYTTPTGTNISGVIETTDNVMRKLLTSLGQVGSSVVGPAAYASYVVRGDNLVTAVSYGKAMANFNQFVARLIDDPERASSVENDLSAISEGHGSLPQTSISSSLIQIGNQIVALESLQGMYNETQFPFPLNKRMQFSYFFPVGLHLQEPKYSTTVSVKGAENYLFQSTEAWIVNKNNTILSFSYQNALKSICHPRIHNPAPCAQALQAAFPNAPGNIVLYGRRYERPGGMNLYKILHEYYGNKHTALITDIAKKTTMTTDDFLHPNNNDLLKFEVHPFFDFYPVDVPGGRATYNATHRNMVGNIPTPLAPNSFHDCRGYQFEQATHFNHVIDASVMQMIQESAFDPAYPIFCYVIEAMIHGQEEKFLLNKNLIALVIETYWGNTGRMAFVNSYFMIKYISQYMGNGAISKELYIAYRKIYGELIAMEHALLKMVGHDTITGRHVAQFVNTLTDHNLLPPFVYHNIFTALFARSDRSPELQVGGEKINEGDKLPTVIHTTKKMNELINDFVNIYNLRVDEDHDQRFQLVVGEFRDQENSVVLEKLFYYVLLPVCTNGHVCGAGVDFNNIATTLTYNGPVFAANVIPENEEVLEHLENGTLRDILKASDINPTVGMIRTLCTSFLTCPFITQLARVTTARDPCQIAATHDQGKRVGHSVLVNGLALFALAEKTRVISECMFYPVPFHKFYSDPMVAATIQPIMGDYVNLLPAQRDGVTFNVPPKFMAEYDEWHKSPMLQYVKTCDTNPLSLSAVVAMHNKLSPIAFITQTKNKMHPGFALTVVRTDEVLSENIMYTSRASTSVFVGQPSVTRKEVRSDAVTFEINHELASLDTGLGYSSIITPAHVAAITTDMGIHCQDLFSMYPSESYVNRDVSNFIKTKIGVGQENARGADIRAFVAGAYSPANPVGLCHGQLATCEVILTPVTADVLYFQSSNSPRGRASCVVSCDVTNSDLAEKFIFDHSQPDPAYEFRSTVNPWASQLGSLGDVLYNSSYRQMSAPGMYSPCRQFFTKDDLLKNNKGLFSLVSEYANRLSGLPATSATDLQYVVINGTDMFLEQPCLFLQEAFPTLSASHRVLLDEYMSYKNTHTPIHFNQFFIEEVAPVKRIFKIGNKVVF
ncbi:major capsid protein [Harp seal herpesvirus]|uniref:Major capsid protein n=1 Tax=phocid gammaherpesvirus 3 TaxID=2560643 RepID=A0A0R5X8M0_9GAMA|nr:major capsid protein [Harp seal herpesvirus]AJG42951.1 major capsid protein [Harp seal herpesvirus]